MADLLPCPFCGYVLPFNEGICYSAPAFGCADYCRENLAQDIADEHVESWFMCCANCACTSPLEDTKEEAAKAWNTRKENSHE